MARLETQINQIYYLPAGAKQVSLVLHDEVLNNNSHLFVIADLVKIMKKTESQELKRITEIILNTFRENKKMTSESLFEAGLSQINQNLADFAHNGKKNWLGKFSALIGLKSNDNIFLASCGSMSAMIYRNSQFLEILDPEKPGEHPLKTFSNFTAGKIKPEDILLLTTSNLLDYVALSNLTKMLNGSTPADASEETSTILKETSSGQEAFGSLFIKFSKAQSAAPVEPAIVDQPAAASLPPEEIYAPLPEDLKKEPEAVVSKETKIFQRMPKVKLPKFGFRIPKPAFWDHLSTWAKFFLISFLIFLILLAATVVVEINRKHSKKNENQTSTLINSLVKDMGDAESALIYRNQDQAVNLLSSVQNELQALKNLDTNAYNEYAPKVAELSNRINRITVVANPNVLLTLKHNATDMVRAGQGFVLADSSTGTVSTYNTSSSDTSGKDLFLLNKIGEIKGLAHIPNTGNVVVTESEMYLVNTAQSQFDLLHLFPKTQLLHLKFLTPDRLYTLDKASNQVLRIAFGKLDQTAPVNLLKSPADLSQAVDLAVDTDVYVLTNSNLNKYTNGSLSSFKLSQPTDQITAANRVFVASNIYILEAAKKRLLIYNKQGVLQMQILFPNAGDMKDLYVDESQRNIFILDGSKIFSITF